MQTETFKMVSEIDRLGLGVLLCSPQQEPVGVLQIAHGMSEHKERYLPFMEYMCECGYACVIHDHRGHGESVRCLQDLGYFYENGTLGIVEDVGQVNRWMRGKYPNKPYFLLGHSMGSLVVRAYLKQHDSTIDGLIVSGSPSATSASKLGIALSAVLKKRYGDHYIPNRYNRIAFGSFNKKFRPAPSQYAWLCSDPDVVRQFDDDPLCGFVFTLNGFQTLFHLMEQVYSRKGWTVTNPDLPVWFLSGELDPCMLSRLKFLQAVDLIHKVGYENVSAKLYPGMRHETLNEPGHMQVFEDIAKRVESWRKN